VNAVLVVVAVVVVVVLLGLWVAYNGLVKRRNRTQEAWSQIDVELKRRHDLIPNLVETVKGYAAHERGTFESVTAARAAAVGAGATGDPAQIAPAEKALSQSLRTLFAVAENYPQLKAVDTFLQLQEQLTATEDKIEFARRYYNSSVRDYNTAMQTFPRSLVANAFSGFQVASYFEADQGDRAVPTVSFPATTGAVGLSASSGPAAAAPTQPADNAGPATAQPPAPEPPSPTTS
jgi:LemA protein